MKMTVFWDTAPCGLIKIGRRFRGVYCLHYIIMEQCEISGFHGCKFEDDSFPGCSAV
jgi:hypothetical protein